MPYRILSSDLLLADIVVDHDTSSQPLKDLVAGYQAEGKMLPGSKMSITKEQAIRFARAIAGDDPHAEIKDEAGEYIEAVNKLNEFKKIPGGSATNMLVTDANLLSSRIAVDFLGVTGRMQHDAVIEKSLTDVGINLFPPRQEMPENAESGLSFVIRFANGERAIATYPGNAKNILRGNMITERHVNNVDAVFVQAGLDRKMGDTTPVQDGEAPISELGVADTLLHWRYEKDKELILALPTQADFGTDHWSHEAKAAHTKELIREANVILSNGEELARTFTKPEENAKIEEILKNARKDPDKALTPEEILTTDRISDHDRQQFNLLNHSIPVDRALLRLRRHLEDEGLQVAAHATGEKKRKWTGSKRQVAFITLGDRGAAVVTKDYEDRVKAPHIDKKLKEQNKGNTLGCGDTAYAGFLTGYVAQGLQSGGEDLLESERRDAYRVAARLGMELAGAKLEETSGPRLADPLQSLWRRDDNLAEMVDEAQRHGRASHAMVTGMGLG